MSMRKLLLRTANVRSGILKLQKSTHSNKRLKTCTSHRLLMLMGSKVVFAFLSKPFRLCHILNFKSK